MYWCNKCLLSNIPDSTFRRSASWVGHDDIFRGLSLKRIFYMIFKSTFYQIIIIGTVGVYLNMRKRPRV